MNICYHNGNSVCRFVLKNAAANSRMADFTSSSYITFWEMRFKYFCWLFLKAVFEPNLIRNHFYKNKLDFFALFWQKKGLILDNFKNPFHALVHELVLFQLDSWCFCSKFCGNHLSSFPSSTAYKRTYRQVFGQKT